MKKNHLKKAKWNLHGRRRGLLFAMLGIISFSFFGLLSGLFADIGSADTKVPTLRRSYTMNDVKYYNTGTDGTGALDRDLFRDALLANNSNAQGGTKAITPLESWQDLAFMLACQNYDPSPFSSASASFWKGRTLQILDLQSYMLMNRGYFGNVQDICKSAIPIKKTLSPGAVPDCPKRIDVEDNTPSYTAIYPLNFSSSLESAEASVMSDIEKYAKEEVEYGYVNLDGFQSSDLKGGGSNVFSFHAISVNSWYYSDIAIYFSNFKVQPVLFDELGKPDAAGVDYLLDSKSGTEAIEWPNDISKDSYNVRYFVNDTGEVDPNKTISTKRTGSITNSITTKESSTTSKETNWKVGASYEQGVKDVWKVAFNGEYSEKTNAAISAEVQNGQSTTQTVETGEETKMSMPAYTAFCAEFGEDTAYVTRTFNQPVRITYDVDIVEYDNLNGKFPVFVPTCHTRRLAHFSSNNDFGYENALDSVSKRWKSHEDASGTDEEGVLWSNNQTDMLGQYTGGPSNLGFADFKTMLTKQYPFVANGITTIRASRDIYVSKFSGEMPTLPLLDMDVVNMPISLEFEPNTKNALDLDDIEVNFVRGKNIKPFAGDTLQDHGEWVLETRNIDGSYEPAYGNTIASISKTILGRNVLDIGSTKGTIYLTFYPYETDKGYPYWNVTSNCKCYTTRDTLKRAATIEINVK